MTLAKLDAQRAAIDAHPYTQAAALALRARAVADAEPEPQLARGRRMDERFRVYVARVVREAGANRALVVRAVANRAYARAGVPLPATPFLRRARALGDVVEALHALRGYGGLVELRRRAVSAEPDEVDVRTATLAAAIEAFAVRTGAPLEVIACGLGLADTPAQRP